jgi:hypothetical protein
MKAATGEELTGTRKSVLADVMWFAAASLGAGLTIAVVAGAVVMLLA